METLGLQDQETFQLQWAVAASLALSRPGQSTSTSGAGASSFAFRDPTPPPPYSEFPPISAAIPSPSSQPRKRSRASDDEGPEARSAPQAGPSHNGVRREQSSSSGVEGVGRSKWDDTMSAIAWDALLESTSPPPVQPIQMRWPTGAIRITRTPGRASSGAPNTVSMEEIFVKESMQEIWLHFFFVDQNYLLPLLPVRGNGPHGLRNVPIYLGQALEMERRDKIDRAQQQLNQQSKFEGAAPMFSTGQPQGKQNSYSRRSFDAVAQVMKWDYQDRFGPNFHASYAKASGCSHSKIALIKYEGFLRVLITSANFDKWDMELADNHYYIHDFPLLPSKNHNISKFESDLFDAALENACPERFLKRLRGRYDFSTARAKIITSVPRRTHPYDERKSNYSGRDYGLFRLARLAAAATPKRVRKDVVLETCSASLGGLHKDNDWLWQLFAGIIGMKVAEAKEKLQETVDDLPPINIVFPSYGNVMKRDGIAPEGSSNMGSHIRWNEASDELKALFYEYHSVDEGCMTHQKFMVALSRSNPTSTPLWITFGSANFSQGGWGSRANTKTVETLDRANLEVGVFIEKGDIEGLLEEGDWQGVFTYKRPLKRYTKAAKPWTSSAWSVRRTVEPLKKLQAETDDEDDDDDDDDGDDKE